MAENRWLATGNFFTAYQTEQRIFRTHLDRLLFFCFLAALFIWPVFFKLSTKYMLVIDSVLVAIIAIYGLNLLTGFAGLISIGHAAFVGVGAYTLAAFSQTLGGNHVVLTHAWPLMIVLSGVVGAVVGGLVGLPALRLKHLYLAIATLSFQKIFEWTINFMTFFNQGESIYIGRVYWLTGRVSREEHYFFWYYVILVIVVVLGFAVRNILRSRYGRSLMAVRDNDRAADAMGIHPGLTKVYAFALAGFFAGIAGALHAYLWTGVNLGAFTLHHSISYLAMAIVGGLGSLNGSFFGPAAIHFLELQVEHLSEIAGRYMTSAGDLATALKPLTFGLVIVLFLMFESRGIANWWRIVRAYLKLWPFRY